MHKWLSKFPETGGKKGHVDTFDDYLTDVRYVLDMALDGKPAETKCFLLGHSMGGLVAILFALVHQDRLDGLVISSPALGVSAPVPAAKAIAAKAKAKA